MKERRKNKVKLWYRLRKVPSEAWTTMTFCCWPCSLWLWASPKGCDPIRLLSSAELTQIVEGDHCWPHPCSSVSGQCFCVRVRTSHSHAYCVYYATLWIETSRSTVHSWAHRKEEAYWVLVMSLAAFNKSWTSPIPRPLVWGSSSTSIQLFQSHQISTSDYGPKITPEEVNCRMCKLSLRRLWKVQESLRSCDPDLGSPCYLITPKTISDENRNLALSRVLLGQPHTPSWVYWKEGKEGEKEDGRRE